MSKQNHLKAIDFAAFQNLLRVEDDRFLRSCLPPRSYRIAKRLRIRAVQEYLFWIAQNCSEAQKHIASSVYENHGSTDVRLLSKLASNLRILSLRFWFVLWLQWFFPSLDIRPGSILDVYETLTEALPALQATLQ